MSRPGTNVRSGGLDAVTVADVMHPGVLTCPPETPLREVARMMTRHRIHAVVVFSEEDEDSEFAGIWGVVSDSDLVAAAASRHIDGRTAGGTARSPLVTIGRLERLERAAELMQQRGVGHLVVVSPSTDRPLGIVSGLDVVRAIARELEPGHEA
jgi:CBS domain-containing protein